MKKLIVANWKLNPGSPREARELFAPVKRAVAKLPNAAAVICPPAVFLANLGARLPARGLQLGAQDSFWEEEGAFTGEISTGMLRRLGVSYVIIGHSERRARGDSDEIINRKIKAVLKQDLRVILCVGERERDSGGRYLQVIREQVEQDLRNVPRVAWGGLLIAYEPLWAIGVEAKSADTPASFLEQAIFIRKVVSNAAGAIVARSLPVLYGGSVTSKNAADFLGSGQADGLLVGRESLRADHFIEILKIASRF